MRSFLGLATLALIVAVAACTRDDQGGMLVPTSEREVALSIFGVPLIEVDTADFDVHLIGKTKDATAFWLNENDTIPGYFEGAFHTTAGAHTATGDFDEETGALVLSSHDPTGTEHRAITYSLTVKGADRIQGRWWHTSNQRTGSTADFALTKGSIGTTSADGNE